MVTVRNASVSPFASVTALLMTAVAIWLPTAAGAVVAAAVPPPVSAAAAPSMSPSVPPAAAHQLLSLYFFVSLPLPSGVVLAAYQ